MADPNEREESENAGAQTIPGEMSTAQARQQESGEPCGADAAELSGDERLALFKMVFEAAQMPDANGRRLQRNLAAVLTAALCVQVLWAIILIPVIIFIKSDLPDAMIQFITLLVTAILAEVVAMAFFMVRFVFRTPIDTLLDLLKDILGKKK